MLFLALVAGFPAAAGAADVPMVELQSLTPQPLPIAAPLPKAPLTAVHFWATWCAPCVVELPEVDKAAAKYADKGFRVVALSLDTDMSKVKEFYAARGIKTLTPALDADMSSIQAVQARGMPATIFYNEKGEAIARADGPLDWNGAKLTSFIESSLK